VRHAGIVAAGKDRAFRVFRPALCQPQVDAALLLTDGEDCRLPTTSFRRGAWSEIRLANHLAVFFHLADVLH
jgi:hypothetical protein